jgi:2-dehydropantoate 2-reductase
MKIAVVGAGAIGGYLGAKLARSGQEVTFIARNRNLEAINAHGFKLLLEDGSEEHTPAGPNLRALQRYADAGPQDVVLLTVKAHQVPDLLPDLRGLFGPQTMVVTMINGVPWWYFHKLAGPYEGRSLQSLDPEGLIAANIEPERLIGSVVYPASELVAPGVVKLIEGNRFSLGELDGSRSERIEALSKVMMAAGFKSPVSRDIRSEIWVKLWGNLCFNPLSALTHATLEDICRFPATRELATQMMAEGKAVAEKLGVVFKISLEQRIAGAEAVGAHKTSMLQDVEAGRALELQALVGAVVELGRITDTPTPHVSAIYAATSLLAQTLASQQGRLQVQRG